MVITIAFVVWLLFTLTSVVVNSVDVLYSCDCGFLGYCCVCLVAGWELRCFDSVVDCLCLWLVIRVIALCFGGVGVCYFIVASLLRVCFNLAIVV